MNRINFRRRFSLLLFLTVVIFALTSCGLGVPRSGKTELEEKMSKLESEKAELEKQYESLKLEVGAPPASAAEETTPETAAGAAPEAEAEQASARDIEEPVTETLSQAEKEKLPPRRVFAQIGGKTVEVSMPEFQNLAEQESFIKHMNDSLITFEGKLDLEKKYSEPEKLPSFSVETVPADQTHSTQVATDPDYKAEDWAYVVILDTEEQEHRLGFLPRKESERLRLLFAENGENNAIKTVPPEKIDSYIAFTDGLELGFVKADLLDGDGPIQLVSASGEVYDLPRDNKFIAALLTVYEDKTDSTHMREENDPVDKARPPRSLRLSFDGIPGREKAAVILENKSGESWNYFKDYTLYRYNGAAFEQVPYAESSDMSWEPSVLPAGGKVTLDLDLAHHYGELPRGLYRFSKNIVNSVMKNNMAALEYYSMYFVLP